MLCVWVGRVYLRPIRRVGIQPVTEKQIAVIPASIEQLHEQYEVVEREPVAPEWDYIWNTVIEEGREKKLKRQSFSRSPQGFLPYNSNPDEILIAESAVKVSRSISAAYKMIY